MSDTVRLSAGGAVTRETAPILSRENLLMNAAAIEGWYPYESLERLYDLACGSVWRKRGFLEIGTWLGRSAYVLAGVAKSLGIRLVCVDTWTGLVGRPNDPRYQMADALAKAKANLKPFADYITFLQGDSREVLKQFPHNSFNLVHIDGDHSSPIVNLDIAQGWKLVAEEGVLCGDDYEERDVAEAVGLTIPRYSDLNVFDNRTWSVWKETRG